MNVFDIIGPVMIGPSSSHTAGAARIGGVARALLGISCAVVLAVCAVKIMDDHRAALLRAEHQQQCGSQKENHHE